MATTTDNINIKINVDATKSEQSTTNYKAKIRELKEEMVALQVETNGLADATEEQRAQYAALEQQAGQIADALGDVSARVNANADDFQNFNAVMEGAKGLTAFAQGVAGVTSLLGINNDAVTKTIQVMMSLQSIMTSLNVVQQMFNKDSKVRIALEKLLSTTNTKVAATTAVETGATKAATVAQRGLNAAMKANPIILIVSALISLIAVTGTFIKKSIEAKKASEDEAKANEDLKKSIEDLEKTRRQAAADTSNNTQQTKDNINNIHELAKAAKEGSEEQASYFKQLADATGLQVTSLEEAEKAVKNYNEVQVYAKLAIQNAKDEIALQNGLLKAAKEAYDNGTISLYQYDTRVDNCNKTISRQNKIIAENTATLDANKKTAGAATNATNKHTTSVNTQVKKLSELQEALRKLNKDIAVYNEDWEEAARVETSIATAEWEKQRKEYEKLIKQTKNKERIAVLNELIVKGEENLQNDIAEINKKYGKKIWDDKVELLDSESATYWDDYIKLLTEGVEKGYATEKQLKDANRAKTENEDSEAAQKLANQYELEAKRQEVAKAKGKAAGAVEGAPEYFDAMIEVAEAQRELELEQLEQDKEAKLLSEEDYQIRKKEIIDKYNTDNYNEAKRYAELELQAEAEKQQYIASLYSAMRGFINDIQEAELADAEGNEKKQKEIKKKYAIMEAMMNIGEIGINTAKGIMGAWSAYAEIPFVGPGLAAALTAVIAVLGAVQTAAAVTQLNTKIKKAKRGAYIVGPSHAEGGVPYELEGGEAVLNKRAMSIPAYRNMASAMNVATGGVAFPGTNPNAGMTAMVDEKAVDAIVRRTVAGIAAIPVVVSEESITNAQRNVGVSVDRSRI